LVMGGRGGAQVVEIVRGPGALAPPEWSVAGHGFAVRRCQHPGVSGGGLRQFPGVGVVENVVVLCVVIVCVRAVGVILRVVCIDSLYRGWLGCPLT
jgi:hypothetical protein